MAKLWGAPNFLLNGPSLVHLKEQERGPDEALSRIIVKELEALHLNREALAQPKAFRPSATHLWSDTLFAAARPKPSMPRDKAVLEATE